MVFHHVDFNTEMSQILAKLHETFIALAGQLQMIHEAVKVYIVIYPVVIFDDRA